ncbi:unnamed protein product [Lactuca virosa]|uniref:Helicase XPB/Ssl2 N-terminal domain-containing protein n=1 Tax=Lactuca virosa TaxID=75947 RepID=A0AAU9P1N5_9ASTR|nr:unnamed protein product [Lactuca virosa]
MCLKLTPHSLYAAVSVGLETETIIPVLNKLSKSKLPEEMIDFIHASTSNYGKIVKVEEKLAKGWGGENAYHVKGYRYLLVDGDRSISRASPPRKSNNPNEGCFGELSATEAPNEFLHQFKGKQQPWVLFRSDKAGAATLPLRAIRDPDVGGVGGTGIDTETGNHRTSSVAATAVAPSPPLPFSSTTSCRRMQGGCCRRLLNATRWVAAFGSRAKRGCGHYPIPPLSYPILPPLATVKGSCVRVLVRVCVLLL